MIMKKWDSLPESMKTDEVKPYYLALKKKTGSLIVKRLFDIIVSLILLILLSPVFLVISIMIKTDSKGPVMFRQVRVTQYGKTFRIFKFRTMVTDAEKLGTQVTVDSDSRITKTGNRLRKCRLDEIPQLLNILKGDMSIVGPRPERQTYIDEFCEETPEFIYRLKVKAGLTGYAQIYGKYNTTPLDKLKLDLMYIESYSVLLDIRLIFLTLKIMFTKESTEGVEEGQNHA